MRLINPLRRPADSSKVLVIGLDCAAAELVVDRWRDDLCNQTYLQMLVSYRSTFKIVIDVELQHLSWASIDTGWKVQ